MDDDCDGTVDETFDGLAEPCRAGVGICLRLGLTQCSPDGTAVVCSATAGEAGQELCNGADDDCDGQTDESFDNVNQACSAGIGACRELGVTVCSPDGALVACNAVPGDPVDELCNGVDDDCDESTDEAFPEVDEPCVEGIGACRRLGVRQCSDDGASTECSATAGAPAMEVCNGVDDDCDGTSDELFPTLNAPCRVGVGACGRTGVQVCTADGADVECDAVAAEPAPEICNGLDDNCDGTVDEGFAGLGQPCEVGIGTCSRRGVTVCSADGQGTLCNVDEGIPGDDICNGLDDDCDGRTDEDFGDIGAVWRRSRSV